MCLIYRIIKNIINRYKRIAYNVAVLRQTAFLMFIPVKLTNFAVMFNFTTAGQTAFLMFIPVKLTNFAVMFNFTTAGSVAHSVMAES